MYAPVDPVRLLDLILFGLALPAASTCAYLVGVTLLSRRIPSPTPSTRTLRFDVVVPAHNEATLIEHTVANLLNLDWPSNRFRVVVVADNCTDDTASIARAAGALVLERRNTTLRGKGYALELAFQTLAAHECSQAVAVVDADTEVSSNLLEAFASRIEQGEGAIQAHYGILNPWASWRTQLMTIAMAAFHVVRSRARERLGLSCGIRGNGWCLTYDFLRKVPYKAFSLAEDLEYGIELGLAGFRVAYADEAHADGRMVSSERIARHQRQRWESGRFNLIVSRTWPLLSAAVRRRSAVCLDLALDLLVLPLSYVTLNVVALVTLAAILASGTASSAPWLWIGIACSAALAIHVLRGWHVSGLGPRGALALVRVPGFLLWKLTLLVRHKPKDWIKTERETS